MAPHLQMNTLDSGNGIKMASASISGQGVYGDLKFESGVHRVQRVPKTESQGRVHTSAASVAVLPEADEVGTILHAVFWPTTVDIPQRELLSLGSMHVQYMLKPLCSINDDWGLASNCYTTLLNRAQLGND